ncbi:MAG: hypothetical protein BSOLF_1055 [Candidatus Carbobacillus altaicus]|uniref:Uncharacterized protein n=1 Tax=Candidatus Carbonibacillus altaicus TaxID=2163959 RepID=A0A2R6XZY5_9BACL|nr:MAG: hypothetical protein BSOLF_1055 [Candidatus Carbobacillus altaicus]
MLYENGLWINEGGTAVFPVPLWDGFLFIFSFSLYFPFHQP